MAPESQASEDQVPQHVVSFFRLMDVLNKLSIAYDFSKYEHRLVMGFLTTMSRPNGMVTLTESRYRKREQWVVDIGCTDQSFVTRLFTSLEENHVIIKVGFDGKKALRALHPSFIEDIEASIRHESIAKKERKVMHKENKVPVDNVDNSVSAVDSSPPQQWTPVHPSSGLQSTPAVDSSPPLPYIEESSIELSSPSSSVASSTPKSVDNFSSDLTDEIEIISNKFHAKFGSAQCSLPETLDWFKKRATNYDLGMLQGFSTFAESLKAKPLRPGDRAMIFAKWTGLWEEAQHRRNTPLRSETPILGTETQAAV